MKVDTQAVQKYDPSTEITKTSLKPSQILNRLNQIALPAIALYAACNTPGVEGGFLFAGAVYVGTNIIGGTMVAVGAMTAPIGGGVLIAGGFAAITAAPYTLVATLPAPTP
jgi:hypothetical protein